MSCWSLPPVDVEMLGQQVVSTLNQLASQRTQTLAVSIEPGERVWVLDRSLVKQILYHTVFSVMQLAGENSTIRVHVSRKGQALHLAVWLSNPWLGDGLPQSVVQTVSGHDPKTYLSRWRIADWLPHAPGLAWVILPISAGA